MSEHVNDTIFATATPPGAGGIGVIRISGPRAAALGVEITGRELAARRAILCAFRDGDGSVIDEGIAIFFSQPASFTGEDVLELQGHGSPVVLQMLGRRLAALGARPARPGEFSERAFLNDRLDLAQAEAVADLIASETEAAARAAQRSLAGEFSRRVNEVQASLTELRVFIEAALDFPDEEIDFIAESDVRERLDRIDRLLDGLLRDARQGQILRDGVTVAIIGLPNAGKSSLLNALSGRDSAIVTDIPGTTRDVLRETLSLDGLPLHIADTAGIRESSDRVEAEGVRRARQALQSADLALLVVDVTAAPGAAEALRREIPDSMPCIRVENKIDLRGEEPIMDEAARTVRLSALTGAGMEGLVTLMGRLAGRSATGGGTFSARERHLEALRRCRRHLAEGRVQLVDHAAAETLAEELRLAQRELGAITGEFLPDDLLGAIFSSFCIGK